MHGEAADNRLGKMLLKLHEVVEGHAQLEVRLSPTHEDGTMLGSPSIFATMDVNPVQSEFLFPDRDKLVNINVQSLDTVLEKLGDLYHKGAAFNLDGGREVGFRFVDRAPEAEWPEEWSSLVPEPAKA